MASFSLTQWLVVLAVVLIVFGAGRLPKTMGDLAKGVRAFRAGLRDDSADGAVPADAAAATPTPLPPQGGHAPAGTGATVAAAASRVEVRGE